MKLVDYIKNLVYGNLNKDTYSYLLRKKDSIFSDYVDMFNDTPYPNLSDTQADIQTIIETQAEYQSKPNWKKYKKFMKIADEDIHKLLYKRLIEIGVPFTQKEAIELSNTQEDVGVLVIMLKQIYQRPRPYQIAYYTNQPLHNFNTITGNSPSYPSGHALQVRFLMNIVASKHPRYKKQIRKLADDIAFTRIVLGVHYPSDNKFGTEIAEKLSNLPSIKDKYFGKN